MLGVTETHLPGVGRKVIGDLELIYSGRSDGIHRQGVGLLMSKKASKACLGWQGISNRLLMANFRTKKVKVSVIVVYAPNEPLDSITNNESDEFYLELQQVIDRIPKRNMLILLGDFNAQVGTNRERWYPCIGNQGIGKENGNGNRLLRFCMYNKLVITNTVFRHKKVHKVTWYSRDNKTTNLIDYVIVNRRLASSVKDTRVYRSAVIDSASNDHRLVISKLSLRFKSRKGNYMIGKFDVARLEDPTCRAHFQEKLNEKLENLEIKNVEEGWSAIRDSVCEVALNVLGKKKSKLIKNVSEKALSLINDRNKLHEIYLGSKTEENRKKVREIEKTLKKELKKCENDFMDKIAEDLEDAAKRHNLKVMYEHVRNLSGRKKQAILPVKNEKGEQLHDKEQIKDRWSEHFKKVLNRDRVESVIDENEKIIEKLDINCEPFTVEELNTVVKKLKNGKAAGPDQVVGEFLKYGGSVLKNKLLEVINRIFLEGEVPEDFRRTLITPVYKKGDKTECLNYRGISLISIGSKVLGMMILLRLRQAIDNVLREEQCGFRKGRGCTDQIFSLRIIIEKCLQHQVPLAIGFIDYEQAFDSASRSALLKILPLYGIPDRYVRVISALYMNNMAAVKIEGEVSAWFSVESGVKQGCVLSPFIWIILMDYVLRRTVKRCKDIGLSWNGKLLTDLDYADDLGLLGKSVDELNKFVEVLRKQGSQIGLKINVKKTKVMKLGEQSQAELVIENEKVEEVGKFIYLGSVISNDGSCKEDLQNRIAKGQSVFSQLRKVWENRKIRLRTKLRIFEATVISVVRYGSETWALRRKEEDILDVFQRNCLRTILGIRRRDNVSNETLYERSGSNPLSKVIAGERLRWLGHVLRMTDERLPRLLLFGKPQEGRKKAGRPVMGWEEVIRKDLKNIGLSWEVAKVEAQNRGGWRRSVRQSTVLRRLPAAMSL